MGLVDNRAKVMLTRHLLITTYAYEETNIMLRLPVCFAMVLCAGICNQAAAEVLVATETVIGSGVFDGQSFNDALVTLTGTIDSSTLDVDNPPDGFAAISLTGNATVAVGGVSDTLTGRSVNPANGSLFNGPFALNSTALSETSTTFMGADVGLEAEVVILSASDSSANYATALVGTGSVSGHAGISVGYEFATSSGGFLQLNSTASNATVTISAAPEPGSLILCCLGAVGMALVTYRKGRHLTRAGAHRTTVSERN
jgi:hypothetical protein